MCGIVSGYTCVVFVSDYRCMMFVNDYSCVVFVSSYWCVVFVSDYRCVMFVSDYSCVVFVSSYRCVLSKTVQSQGGGYRCLVFDERKTVQPQDDVLVWLQVCGVWCEENCSVTGWYSGLVTGVWCLV